jgi:phage shock protein A
MRLFPRTGDIRLDRVEEILSQAADPARTLRLIVKDIEEALIETRGREAKLLNQARNIHGRIAAAEHLQAELADAARQSMTSDREDLARRALAGKYESIHEVAALRNEIRGLLAEADSIAVEVTRLETVLANVSARRARWTA